MINKLKRDFYERDTLTVAKELLGNYLVYQSLQGVIKGKIVETEAYIGSMDKASHAYNNRKTQRTIIQFGRGGFAYVYMIYGMYYCFNVVTNKENYPEAVLIRALEVVEGLEIVQSNIKEKKFHKLCSGPGKLCKAIGINKEHNGIDLCGDELYIEKAKKEASFQIQATPRINIDYAEEAIHFPWRFLIQDNECVSKKR